MTDINVWAALFYAMMGVGYSPMEPPNGFSDAFINSQGIDFTQSKNVVFERQRTLIHPERKLGHSVIHKQFDTIDGWEKFISGSGKVSVELTNETDAAVGKYTLKLSTGPVVGSKAGVSKSGISVPSSFGILIIPDVEGLAGGKDDPLELNVRNSDQKLLKLRFLHGSLLAFINNQWIELSNHIKAYPGIHGPEWWIEVNKVDGDNYSVGVYVGTQRKGEVTGVIPTENRAASADIEFLQYSNSLPNRVSRVAIIEIGETQRAQEMTLVSMPRASSKQPFKGCMALAIEDVSVALSPNNNLLASLSRDNGITWLAISLQDMGDFGWGELGTKKRIHLLAGCTNFSAAPNGKIIRYKIEGKGGDFFVLQNVTAYWE